MAKLTVDRVGVLEAAVREGLAQLQHLALHADSGVCTGLSTQHSVRILEAALRGDGEELKGMVQFSQYVRIAEWDENQRVWDEWGQPIES